MSFYTRKDDQTYREGQMPLHYPADRVYLDGDTSKNVQDECVRKTGDTMSGTLQLGDSSTRGELRILGNDKTHYGRFYNSSGVALSDNRNYLLPNKSGTMALLEDFTPVDIKSDYNASGIISLYKVGKLVEANIEVTPSAIAHGSEIISKLPKPYGSAKYINLGMANGQTLPCLIENVSGKNYAHLYAYYPTGSQTAARIDATITYFADI